MTWTCDQTVETCPCVCCQLERCSADRDEARKIARHCRNILHACGLQMGYREEREAPAWLIVVSDEAEG